MNFFDSDYEKEYIRKKLSKPLTKLEKNIIGIISICGLLIGIIAILFWFLALFGITIIWNKGIIMKIRLGFVANSSSEAFICNTKFSLSEVKEKLEKIVETYNSLFNTNILFDEMFKEPIILDEKYEKTIYIWEQSIRNLKKYYGRVFIESSDHDDNSIPFCLLELIEELFEAERYHC